MNIAWKTEKRFLKELIPFDKNPRTLSKSQYQALKESLLKFDLVEIPAINSDNTIIAGHQRIRILSDSKGNNHEIEVRVPSRKLTDDEFREYLIRSNKNLGDWDWTLLNEDFEKQDLLDWGFEEIDFEDDIEPYNKDTQVDNSLPDVQENPVTLLEDVYQLGPHRLICGDATKQRHIEKLMGEDIADLIVTDPPYNVDYQGKTKSKLNLKNDSMGDDLFLQFLIDTFSNCHLFTKEGGSAYVFHSDFQGMNFRKAFVESGFDYKQCCIWVKNIMVMGRQNYHWQHEPILYGCKKGAKHFWNSDRKQTTIWNFDRPQQNKEHPTMKPLDLISYPILNSSKKNQIVLDVFGGSGSTLIASEKLGRICRTMELDPRYCDVIVKRYITYCKENNREFSVTRNGKPCTVFNP